VPPVRPCADQVTDSNLEALAWLAQLQDARATGDPVALACATRELEARGYVVRLVDPIPLRGIPPASIPFAG